MEQNKSQCRQLDAPCNGTVREIGSSTQNHGYLEQHVKSGSLTFSQPCCPLPYRRPLPTPWSPSLWGWTASCLEGAPPVWPSTLSPTRYDMTGCTPIIRTCKWRIWSEVSRCKVDLYKLAVAGGMLHIRLNKLQDASWRLESLRVTR